MSIEAMKQALEVLEDFVDDPRAQHQIDAASAALRQAIAEAEQEPVACQHKRYSIDVHEQIGTCIDCGSEGRMRFVVDDTHPQPKQEQGEPLEYWNAVEGWVKLDEVREHFDSVSCATIYKNGGEGRVPLYTHPQPKREWVGLTDEEYTKMWHEHMADAHISEYGRAIETKLKELNT